jgi:hypothetical protein
MEKRPSQLQNVMPTKPKICGFWGYQLKVGEWGAKRPIPPFILSRFLNKDITLNDSIFNINISYSILPTINLRQGVPHSFVNFFRFTRKAILPMGLVYQISPVFR